MATEYLLIPVGIIAVVGLRLGLGAIYHHRIRAYIESLGGQLQRIEWRPFGLVRARRARYRVFYVDRQGAHHDTYSQTSLYFGVYFVEDTIIQPSRT